MAFGFDDALRAVGIGASLLGGDSAADAAADAARANAQFDRYKADVVEANAKEQEARYRRMAKRQMGAARAAVGGSGVQMTGSAMEAIGDSEAEAELQALTIRHEGEVQAKSLRYAAELGIAAGNAQASSIRLSSAGQALIGAADVVSNW